jgi:hypothetical protein
LKTESDSFEMQNHCTLTEIMPPTSSFPISLIVLLPSEELNQNCVLVWSTESKIQAVQQPDVH